VKDLRRFRLYGIREEEGAHSQQESRGNVSSSHCGHVQRQRDCLRLRFPHKLHFAAV
jgi:hypothetical protein